MKFFSKQDTKKQRIITLALLAILLIAGFVAFKTHDIWREEQNAEEFQLGAISMQVESKGATSHLSWNKVEGASRYEILRYYDGSGKYKIYRTRDAREDDGDTIVYDMGREAGKYKIRAVLEIGEKKFESHSEKEITIESTSKKAKSYSSLTVVKTIDSGDVKKITNAGGNVNATHAQSMCVTDDAIVVALVNRANSKGALQLISKSGKTKRIVDAGYLGHANGCTCNPYKGEIYVMTSYASRHDKTVRVFDDSSLKSKKSIELRTAPSAIAYDRSTDRFAYTASSRIYIADGNMLRKKTITRKRAYHSQDVAAYNGIIMSCIWLSGNASYIDMYRESDGQYLGSISVPMGEIESCCVDDGYLLLLFNGGNIYKTKKRIELGVH